MELLNTTIAKYCPVVSLVGCPQAGTLKVGQTDDQTQANTIAPEPRHT